jgi:ubiquinone/menaquinone biosynthesis C-methylase UbiE
MTALPANFDRLARVYRALEFFAFGRDLELARFCFLERLSGCRNILLLGEGDGRSLARIVRIVPSAQIHVIDASAAMLARAAARIAGTEAAARVRFDRADLLTWDFAPTHYDGVSTFFFLDCFTENQAAAIVGRVRETLKPGAPWLFADFVMPARGLARCRARLWLSVLFAFFRWETDLPARTLPPSEEILAKAGFERIAMCDFQRGLVRSAIFARPPIEG